MCYKFTPKSRLHSLVHNRSLHVGIVFILCCSEFCLLQNIQK